MLCGFCYADPLFAVWHAGHPGALCSGWLALSGCLARPGQRRRARKQAARGTNGTLAHTSAVFSASACLQCDPLMPLCQPPHQVCMKQHEPTTSAARGLPLMKIDRAGEPCGAHSPHCSQSNQVIQRTGPVVELARWPAKPRSPSQISVQRLSVAAPL
jgi:hypothetical protein